MAVAKLTIMGMQQFLKTEGSDIFSNLSLPDSIDAETAQNAILFRCAEFPLVWANPYFVQDMIGVWSSKMYHVFERWQEALTEDYDPLHNYDRTEEWTDSSTANGENLENVSAFDSSTLQPNTQNISSGSSQAKRSGRAYGNIGVTTSATMLTEEINVRSQYNIYDLVANSFCDEFCMKIY